MRCPNPNGRYVDWQWSPFWWVDLWGYIRTDLWFAQVPLCLYRVSGSDPSCSRGESLRPGIGRRITDTRDSPGRFAAQSRHRRYADTPARHLLAPGFWLLFLYSSYSLNSLNSWNSLNSCLFHLPFATRCSLFCHG